jgi:hypothetical protein
MTSRPLMQVNVAAAITPFQLVEISARDCFTHTVAKVPGLAAI